MVADPRFGDKEVTHQALDKSVKIVKEASPGGPGGMEGSIFWMMGSAADEFEPWGRRTKIRDAQLRDFIGKESLFTSALGTVCARNAGFSWSVNGPPRTSAKIHQLLQEANNGAGWEDFVVKISMDLMTQDTGAFFEVVRMGDNPTAAPLAINHLDASRCWHTGDPFKPVLYQDMRSRYHLLNWWQVGVLSEMPMPLERLPGIQLCAESRLLLAAQIIRNVAIYKKEKTGGRHNRAVYLVSGITVEQIQDAMSKARVAADGQGFMRYMEPLFVSSVDPTATVDVKTLELASLPDGWDEEVTFKQYVAQVAMAFLTDYQEFAPLPGGGLGTSNQSQILHDKSRGKGPGLFQKIVANKINALVTPDNVEFAFDEQDIQADMEMAALSKTRADERAVRITSGELAPVEARQIAMDAGDLPRELFEKSGGLDMTGSETFQQEEKPGTEGETTQAQGEKPVESPQPSPAIGEKSYRKDQCMDNDCDTPPEFEILHGNSESHAWFCRPHLMRWDSQHPNQIDAIWRLNKGRASKRTRAG